MKGINIVSLGGTVGQDPEVRQINENVKVAKFSIAVSESYKNKDGERVEKTNWFKIEAWRGLANVVESYVKKGTNVFISGTLEDDSYEKDGIKHRQLKVVARDLTLLPGGSQSSGSPVDEANKGAQSYVNANNTSAQKEESAVAVSSNDSWESDDVDDDLPF